MAYVAICTRLATAAPTAAWSATFAATSGSWPVGTNCVSQMSAGVSAGGHLRSRRDTRGHGTKTVRDREARESNSSSPWLYIQSEAIQGVTEHLGPPEFVHLKKIRGTQAIVCIN
jgi:hypothetical protein